MESVTGLMEKLREEENKYVIEYSFLFFITAILFFVAIVSFRKETYCKDGNCDFLYRWKNYDTQKKNWIKNSLRKQSLQTGVRKTQPLNSKIQKIRERKRHNSF